MKDKIQKLASQVATQFHTDDDNWKNKTYLYVGGFLFFFAAAGVVALIRYL